MNERIKELIDKAYIEVPHERDWDAMSSVFDKEKFAELIIKECCDMFTELRTRPADLAALDVKKHFGVK